LFHQKNPDQGPDLAALVTNTAENVVIGLGLSLGLAVLVADMANEESAGIADPKLD
jgi:hypothetical protein